MQSGDSNTMVAALLGADNWGGASGLVSTHVQSFLAEIYRFLHAPAAMTTAASAMASIGDIACQVCLP